MLSTREKIVTLKIVPQQGADEGRTTQPARASRYIKLGPGNPPE